MKYKPGMVLIRVGGRGFSKKIKLLDQYSSSTAFFYTTVEQTNTIERSTPLTKFISAATLDANFKIVGAGSVKENYIAYNYKNKRGVREV